MFYSNLGEVLTPILLMGAKVHFLYKKIDNSNTLFINLT
jgi:hypothetical protein